MVEKAYTATVLLKKQPLDLLGKLPEGSTCRFPDFSPGRVEPSNF